MLLPSVRPIRISARASDSYPMRFRALPYRGGIERRIGQVSSGHCFSTLYPAEVRIGSCISSSIEALRQLRAQSMAECETYFSRLGGVAGYLRGKVALKRPNRTRVAVDSAYPHLT